MESFKKRLRSRHSEGELLRSSSRKSSPGDSPMTRSSFKLKQKRRATIYLAPHSQPPPPESRRNSGLAGRPVLRLLPDTQLVKQERMFLEAATRGDKATVLSCLQPPTPVDVNCKDALGRTAIQIAADNENLELIEVLLIQKDIHIGTALLYAIIEGVLPIVERMINHHTISTHMLGEGWAEYTKLTPSCEFSPDISPIILAAHCNQFEILQLFLSRGAYILKPHPSTCVCHACRSRWSAEKKDTLRQSLIRINTYKALSSPAWLCLTTEDPVHSAFRLSWELSYLARKENEFKKTYISLSEQCEKYAVGLLEECRSTEEVMSLLSKGAGSKNQATPRGSIQDSGILDDVGYLSNLSPDKLIPDLPRLEMALKYQQRKVTQLQLCAKYAAGCKFTPLRVRFTNISNSYPFIKSTG